MKKRDRDLSRAGDDGAPLPVLVAADQVVQTVKEAEQKAQVVNDKIDERNKVSMEAGE